MTMERAREIVGEMVGQHMTMLVDEKPRAFAEWLKSVSLAEMVEANRLVRDDRGTQNEDGATTQMVNCDDRLTAAIYAFLHFEVSTGPGGYYEPQVCDTRKALVMAPISTLVTDDD